MSKSNYLINDMNPFLKILVLLLITLVSSLDFKPFVSGVLIISAFILIYFFTNMNVLNILKSIKGFIIMSLSFIVIILLVRHLSRQPLGFIAILGLGFKIILISIYSSIFVKTTDPTEFVLALIKYFKMPAKLGFAFLTAYRFLPTFKNELEVIKYAHQVRGIEEGKNFILRIWNFKRYVIPMMATAVRKGIRISMAMETRGFGKYPQRTYYRNISMDTKHIVYTSLYMLYILGIVILFYLNDLASIGITYIN